MDVWGERPRGQSRRFRRTPARNKGATLARHDSERAGEPGAAAEQLGACPGAAHDLVEQDEAPFGAAPVGPRRRWAQPLAAPLAAVPEVVPDGAGPHRRVSVMPIRRA